MNFARDSWKDLIYKISKWSKYESKLKFIPTLEKKLKERIKKGSCTYQQVEELREQIKKGAA